MHEFTKEEIAFYSLAWFCGFAASYCRFLRDRDIADFRHVIGFSATGGFVSFGVVAIFFVHSADGPNSSWHWLGVAALVGTLGKEQDKVIKWALSKSLAVGKAIAEALFRKNDK